MKATDILKRFETFLKRYEFAQMKLENGTVLEAEEFAEGSAVFIVTEDERVPLPIGEYTLEDGSMLIIAEEGVIGKVGVEEVEEPQQETEMEEEVVKDEVVEETMSYVSRAELEEAVAEVKEMIEAVKAKLEEGMPVEEEVKDEESIAKEEQLELSAELAKPSSAPLKHNPEATKKVDLKKIGSNRAMSTPMDRILERLSKIHN